MVSPDGFRVAEEVLALRRSLKGRPLSEHPGEIEIWREEKSRIYPRSADVIQSTATTLQICGIEMVSENYDSDKPEPQVNDAGTTDTPNWPAVAVAAAAIPFFLCLIWLGVNWKVTVTLLSAVIGAGAYALLPAWLANFWPRMTVATGLAGCSSPIWNFGAKAIVSIQDENHQVVAQETILASVITNAAETPWQATVAASVCGCILTFIGFRFMNHRSDVYR